MAQLSSSVTLPVWHRLYNVFQIINRTFLADTQVQAYEHAYAHLHLHNHTHTSTDTYTRCICIFRKCGGRRNMKWCHIFADVIPISDIDCYGYWKKRNKPSDLRGLCYLQCPFIALRDIDIKASRIFAVFLFIQYLCIWKCRACDTFAPARDLFIHARCVCACSYVWFCVFLCVFREEEITNNHAKPNCAT